MRELLSNPAVVIVLAIAIGVGVPVGIAVIALRNRPSRGPSQISKAVDAVRQPWKEEDSNLQELSRLVKEVQAKPSEKEDDE
jgi:hypothetical protein